MIGSKYLKTPQGRRCRVISNDIWDTINTTIVTCLLLYLLCPHSAIIDVWLVGFSKTQGVEQRKDSESLIHAEA